MASGYSSTASGGALTPETVIPILFQPLAARSVVMAATPPERIFDAAGGAPVRVPRIASITLADPWRSENTLIAEVDPAYDELLLLPTSLKSLKVLHRLSNELARNSVGTVEQLIGDAFIAAIAREVDKAFLTGDGAGSTITGLANESGIQVVSAVGTPTVDDLHDAEGLLMAANGDPTTAAWFMAPRSFTSLRKQREGAGTGAYLLQPDPTQPGRMTLLGHPVYVTTQIATNTGAGTNESLIMLVDMAQIAIGRDLEPRLDVLKETYGNWDQVALRIVARMDIGALNAPAIVKLAGVLA